MLQKLDQTTMNRLAVAEYLQDLDPASFHMNFCANCIAGHINRHFLGHDILAPDSFTDWLVVRNRAAEFLGLDVIDSIALMEPGSKVTGKDHTPHPQDAARVMRYLAATDTVDWSVA